MIALRKTLLGSAEDYDQNVDGIEFVSASVRCLVSLIETYEG